MFLRVLVYSRTCPFVSVHLSLPPPPPPKKDQMTQLGVCPRVCHDARPQPWLARQVLASPLGRAAGWGVLSPPPALRSALSPLTVPLFPPYCQVDEQGKVELTSIAHTLKYCHVQSVSLVGSHMAHKSFSQIFALLDRTCNWTITRNITSSNIPKHIWNLLQWYWKAAPSCRSDSGALSSSVPTEPLLIYTRPHQSQ